VLIQLRSRRPADDVERLLATPARPDQVTVRLEGDGTLFKPSGERLLTLRRAAVSPEAAEVAYPFLHWLRKGVTYNRGDYAGRGTPSGFITDPKTGRRIKGDGTLSRTRESGKVRSVVVGCLDRSPRTPFCRECALSGARPEAWAACGPFVREVADVFRAVAPDRYAAQAAAAAKVYPSYVIPGTPFTTLTVNNCVSGAYHRDAGDYAPGLGVIAVLRQGTYRGCDLVFPAYGAAVDLGDRDVILFDPHEVHGNTPFRDTVGPEGDPDHGGWLRISVVFYLRTGMLDCLAPAAERERAKHLRGALAPSPGPEGQGGDQEVDP
jgi:hypothetical protein